MVFQEISRIIPNYQVACAIDDYVDATETTECPDAL